MGLIKKGLAYVCELTPEEFKEYRGDIGVPATSPYRDRPIEESLDLFARMRAGEFPNGAHAPSGPKSIWQSGNFNMRDPVIYRINHMHHHRQGDKWCIYPMYDFAHPIQDALEGITHSLCSLEFEASPPTLQLGHRALRPARPSPADRVCPSGHRPHRHEQAEAPQAGGGGPGLRLGRSPDAHPLRPAPPGLYRQIHPEFLRPHRRGQGPPTWWSTAFWSTACGKT